MDTFQKLHYRFICVALFAAVIAGTWDAWWHSALGRESFWSPPHLLLYTAVVLAITAGIHGWYRTKEKLWRRLATLLILVPVSAPFDELWHRVFEVESLSSPLIVWSPPHVILIGSVIGSFLMLLPIMRRDENINARRFFGPLAFAGILSLLLFLASPFQPTGPHALLGFWGTGIIAGLMVGMMLVAKKWIPDFGGAVLVATFLILLSAVGLSEQIAPGLNVPPHDHAPAWLTVFAVLVPALWIDLSRRMPTIIIGVVAGILYGAILYGFSSQFFEPAFQYSSGSMLIAVFAAAVGGWGAGLFAKSLMNEYK